MRCVHSMTPPCPSPRVDFRLTARGSVSCARCGDLAKEVLVRVGRRRRSCCQACISITRMAMRVLCLELCDDVPRPRLLQMSGANKGGTSQRQITKLFVGLVVSPSGLIVRRRTRLGGESQPLRRIQLFVLVEREALVKNTCLSPSIVPLAPSVRTSLTRLVFLFFP